MHVPYCRFVHNAFDILHIGFNPPPILLLTDGAHFENLGLLPLLKRRLRKIVVVDSGHKSTDDAYADSLIPALEKARNILNCSFRGMDGRDVIEDVRHRFVRKQPGQQPRSFKFVVEYYDVESDFSQEKKVAEGQIIFIAPRHPSKCIKGAGCVTWKATLRDINMELDADMWGPGPDLEAAEVDGLTFCCCECCHGSCCHAISDWLCGVFPHHIIVNQFYTPAMFSAYHREGYSACVEAQAAEFLDAAKNTEQYTTSYVSSI